MAVLVLILALTSFAQASSSFMANTIPVRAQGGLIYANMVSEEVRLHKSLGIATNTTPNWFMQQIDHLNPSRGQFNQKYYIDYSVWDPHSGPVFLYIGGEGPLGSSPGGYAAMVGAEQKALLISLEHRYYGQSIPAPLTDAETLKTLNVDNVMADLAAFVNYITETILNGQKRRWIAIGGSYPGALAAWFRIKHPELAFASWSSSGVVHALFDYSQFDRQIAFELPSDCANAIRTVTALAEKAWNDPVQRKRMLGLFNTPDYFTREDFLWMLADSAAMGPQYGYKAALCEAMTPLSSDPLSQFALNWTIPHYGPDFGGMCYYSTACLSDAHYQDQWPNQRSWVFQCCNELAYWQQGYPGSLRSQLITTDYFMAQCRSAFGLSIFPNTSAFNERYGGANPALTKNATRIIAANGSDDPWQGACVQQTLSASYPETTAACDGCGEGGVAFAFAMVSSFLPFVCPSPSHFPLFLLIYIYFYVWFSLTIILTKITFIPCSCTRKCINTHVYFCRTLWRSVHSLQLH